MGDPTLTPEYSKLLQSLSHCLVDAFILHMLLDLYIVFTPLSILYTFLHTVPQGHVWPKIFKKIDANFFWKIYIFNYFLVKKKILENVCKIWHLPKGNLPKIIIIQHQSSEPNLGVHYGIWYVC
jgi:hypothetical protein